MEKFRTKGFFRQFADEDYLILFKLKKNIIPSSQSFLCCMFVHHQYLFSSLYSR